MTAELWVAIVLAGISALAGLAGVVATRRTAVEDGSHSRAMAEVRYLSDQLADERARTDRLEVAVRACHAERDDLELRVRRLEASMGGAHPGGPS